MPEGSSSNLQLSGLSVRKNSTAALSSEIYCLWVFPAVSTFVEYVSSLGDSVSQSTISLIYSTILHRTVYVVLLDYFTPLIGFYLSVKIDKLALCHVISYFFRDDRVWIATCTECST